MQIIFYFLQKQRRGALIGALLLTGGTNGDIILTRGIILTGALMWPLLILGLTRGAPL